MTAQPETCYQFDLTTGQPFETLGPGEHTLTVGVASAEATTEAVDSSFQQEWTATIGVR